MKRTYTSIAITGANRGIGKALALQAALSGYSQIYVLGRNIIELEHVANTCKNFGANCIPIYFDLDNNESMRNAIESIRMQGFPQVWVHNAGTSMRSTYRECSDNVFQTVMQRNFYGTEFATRLILPIITEVHSQSHIVVVSSIAGEFGFPLRSAYCASKAALKGLFETIRLEEKERGLCVSLIYPGRIRTDIALHALTADGSPQNSQDDGLQNGLNVAKCASKILKSVHNCKRDVYIGKSELLMVYLKRYWPALFYWVINRVSAR